VSPDRVRRTRPQRGKSLSAKPSVRRPRRVIYLVAEGEVTEYDYCAALSNAFSARLAFRLVKPAPHVRRNGLTPIKVAHHAIEVAGEMGAQGRASASGLSGPSSAISEIWALFDRDQHPRIPEAMALLSGYESIHVAFSHPSFDLWLLLHFTAVSDAQGGSSGHVHSRLRNHPGFSGFGSHDKRITVARATELMRPDRIATAVRNAKALVGHCPTGCCSALTGHAVHCDPLQRDPSTDVWRLIECLGIPDVLT
jgi:RloB-like protein